MESPGSRARPAVILVDDEELYLRALIDDYRRRGFAVTARRDMLGGEQAYRGLQRQGQSPLLVVDLVQPGEDGGYLGGLDLLRRLRPGAGADVIALADSEAVWLSTVAGSLGARRTVTKPDLRRVEPEHLDSAMRRFLDEVAGRTHEQRATRAAGSPAGLMPQDPLLGALEEMRHLQDRPSVLLLVMRFAAEIVSRGVLYEVGGDHLRVLGRFGLPAGAPDADVLSLERDTLPGRAFWSGRLQQAQGDELATLMPPLPTPPPCEAMALPVLGTDGVAAVVYGDSGSATEGLPHLGALSAVAATASLALRDRSGRGSVLPGV